MKKISLIMTTYNQPEFLDLTLASVENQTLKDFEVIIADDGSDKRTQAVIQKYKHLSLVHVWHNDRGYRKALILNNAIKKATGNYLVFIDGDCILHKDFLYYHAQEKQPGYFLTGRRVELGPQFTQTITLEKVQKGYFDKINFDLWKSCRQKDSKHFHRSIPIKNKFFRALARWDKVNDILGSNFSLYKDDLMKVNGFNEDLKHYWGEDGDLFIRLRNSKLKIKSLKNLAVQFHLYHKRRESDTSMTQWYYDALENNFTYTVCENGMRKIKKQNNIAVSFVIPTYNQLEYTKRCINSIYKNTNLSFELIIIDNASQEDTIDYLKQLQKKYANVRLVLNQTNKGVAWAWNKGIKLAKADYIAILNNDIIVTPNWLKNLLRFSIEKKYLFVGPAYREGKLNYDIQTYAKYFTNKNRNNERLYTYSGFAMLFHKSLFEQVGLFSEEFKVGTYEDADFIMRLRAKHIPFSTTGSAFVHHFKSTTQNLIRKQQGNQYEFMNRDIFQKKWGVKTLKGIIEPKNKLQKEWIKFKNFLNIW